MLDRDLERRLRDAAPTPDAPTADRLDARFGAARGGAGAPVRASGPRGVDRLRERFGSLGWRPAAGALCAMVLAAVVLVSAVRSANDAGTGAGDASSGSAAVQAPAPEPTAESRTVGAAPAAPTAALRSARKVERAASVRLGVARVEEGANEAMAVADRVGGLVLSTNIETGTDNASPTAELELRVPAGQLGRALAALSRLGEVRERTQSSSDVTAVFNAADERLAELRAERHGLLAELGRAQDAGARAAVRRQLAANRVRLQRAAGDRARVDRAARLARIDVTIEQGKAVSTGADEGSAWGLRDAVRDAGRILSVAGAGLVLAAALLLPAGLIGVLLTIAGQRVRRWRRQHALDAG